MRAVIQRVKNAAISCGGRRREMGAGLVVLVACEHHDTTEKIVALYDKVVNLRVFADEDDKMNRSVLDCGGSVLLVPNFTVAGSVRKGRRPEFSGAMEYGRAQGFFRDMEDYFTRHFPRMLFGTFGAMMDIEMTNTGPVTLVHTI